jgi:hypothetical protein
MLARKNRSSACHAPVNSSDTGFTGCEEGKSEYNLEQENLCTAQKLHAKKSCQFFRGAPIDV